MKLVVGSTEEVGWRPHSGRTSIGFHFLANLLSAVGAGLITTVLVVKTARSLAKKKHKVKWVFQEDFFSSSTRGNERINIISVVFYFAASDQSIARSWLMTGWENSESYWRCWVSFDENGRLDEKYIGWWWD